VAWYASCVDMDLLLHASDAVTATPSERHDERAPTPTMPLSVAETEETAVFLRDMGFG